VRTRPGSSRPGLPGAPFPGLAALVLVLAAGCGAREAPQPSGEVLYLRHCAACHGESGRGDGPVAASLQTPPADLTTIARRAGGRFDEARVMGSIDGRHQVAAHGPREMPVWGAVFTGELDDRRHEAWVVLRKARSLTDYLRSIQVD
jgi:mono/diheme cytochrome c family protein